jgi:hypothetical protein
MTFRLLDAGTSREIKKIRTTLAGVERQIRTAKAFVGGELKLVASFVPPFSVSGNPPYAYGAAVGGSRPVRATSNFVQITPSGGLGPYVYSWVVSPGTVIKVTNPALAAVEFYALNAGGFYSANATCTVTDATGATAFVTIPVQIDIN